MWDFGNSFLLSCSYYRQPFWQDRMLYQIPMMMPAGQVLRRFVFVGFKKMIAP